MIPPTRPNLDERFLEIVQDLLKRGEVIKNYKKFISLIISRYKKDYFCYLDQEITPPVSEAYKALVKVINQVGVDNFSETDLYTAWVDKVNFDRLTELFDCL